MIPRWSPYDRNDFAGSVNPELLDQWFATSNFQGYLRKPSSTFNQDRLRKALLEIPRLLNQDYTMLGNKVEIATLDYLVNFKADSDTGLEKSEQETFTWEYVSNYYSPLILGTSFRFETSLKR